MKYSPALLILAPLLSAIAEDLPEQALYMIGDLDEAGPDDEAKPKEEAT